MTSFLFSSFFFAEIGDFEQQLCAVFSKLSMILVSCLFDTFIYSLIFPNNFVFSQRCFLGFAVPEGKFAIRGPFWVYFKIVEPEQVLTFVRRPLKFFSIIDAELPESPNVETGLVLQFFFVIYNFRSKSVFWSFVWNESQSKTVHLYLLK